MKLPKTIKIMGLPFKVEIDHDECDKHGVNGTAFADKCVILMDDPKLTKYPDERTRQILIHEILHQCNHLINVGEEPMNEEKYVEPLSNLLNQIIPQLIPMYTEE